jgi:hypothetical protein
VLDTSTLPATAGGAEASVGWLFSKHPVRVRALVTGNYFPHASKFALGNGADFDLLGGAVRACAGLSAGAFGIGPCVGAELDSMRAFNVQAPHPSGGTGMWWSLLASMLGEWHASRAIAVLSRADLLVPYNPPVFAIEAAQPGSVDHVVYTLPAVALRLTAGIEAHFF